ncbi:bifunctional phosphoserine phosphatase/homoserine phosphotransferase ThrH [Burkholderia sp. WAC0059]|uniref:bifunctional phosphoserine phosphatase/homoserine phosphotransferase ThrH n=1 Tax=Burkholderia sp. WAC0059 TaxID=2066022 RepID=UPI0015E1155A|nr:bifunctional phosphoserine phosphatase/homoserine phosphotransferase ThrH [Burkholderia sp. WAC0059]
MNFICLDVEGVLLPEIWIRIASVTDIAGLSLTTRDEPDFNALMLRRCELLRQHDVSYTDILRIVREVEPLPGAVAFLSEVRRRWPCALISDSFYEFLLPLAPKLGLPTVFCHNLIIGDDGRLTGWRPRLVDQKPQVVRSLQALGFTVIAAGDSYNDLGMLRQAEHGFLVNAPPAIREAAGIGTCCAGLEELLDEIQKVAR